MSVSSVRTRALAGVIAASGMVAAGLLVSPSKAMGTVDALVADPFLFGLVVAGLYLVRPLLAWPTTPLAIVVGYGFGVAAGVPLALVGVVTTVLPVFLVTRWLATGEADTARESHAESEGGGSRFLERAGDVVARYYETAGPLRGVTASRLAPIPSDVATCAAAVSGVTLRQLVVGTAIGELPWTIAAVVVGASAATITSSGLGELGVALSVACALAAVVLLAGPVYRTLRTDRTRTEGAGRSTDS
ncbi:TVP38/TMEM64 family protein [Natrinema versiforme]|uniref:TVP38/TMEM64 family protein n=1 Tax=Natrinema versiforme TaxID=88724 RepID=A0A4P8WG43_9EURY|nr:VTT domain-containing protein [Natrinema versiforme]QCS41922.1 TVP38/TMEM64 family protein [Natrinema versiforme]